MLIPKVSAILLRSDPPSGNSNLCRSVLVGLVLGASGCGSEPRETEEAVEVAPAEVLLAAEGDADESLEDLPAWTGEEATGGDAFSDATEMDLSELDEFEAAKRDFDKASGLVGEGRFEEALPFLERAAKIDPENEEIQYHLAFSLSRLDRVEEAIVHYEKTLEIFPDYAEARINLGNLLMNQGSFPRAEKEFRMALEVAPELASVHNSLGTLLGRQGRVVEAIPLFVEAVSIDPQYIQAHCNLGNAYLAQGRAQEAATQFSRALAIRPNFPPAMGGMQRARLRLKQTNKE